MTPIDQVDLFELTDRYHDLLKDYAELAEQLAEPLEKFGKIRLELQILVEEFAKRGQKIEEPEELRKKVEELEKKNALTNQSE